MNALIVMKKIALRATPSEVRDALTDPGKTKEYFFNCEVFSDWTAGAALRLRAESSCLKKSK